MHSSGSITRKFGPSWKQSTGHTSTQSVYLHLMQFSVTTKGISRRIHGVRRMTRDFRTLARPAVEVSHSLRAASAGLRIVGHTTAYPRPLWGRRALSAGHRFSLGQGILP